MRARKRQLIVFFFSVCFFALASFTLASANASAYVFTFERQLIPGLPYGQPGNEGPDGMRFPVDGFGTTDEVVLDLYLDTEGQSEIRYFSLGILFNPSVFEYDAANSRLADYALYTPLTSGPAGKTPDTWLEPWSNPPALYDGKVPPGLSLLIIEFNEHALRPTVATATNEWLGRISFTRGLPAFSRLTATWENEGTSFLTAAGYESPEVRFVWAPEPTTALLVGLGLAGLALRRTRRL